MNRDKMKKNRWREFQGQDVTAATLTAGQVRVISLLPTENIDDRRDEQYAALKFRFRLKKSSAEAYMRLQESYQEAICATQQYSQKMVSHV